MFIIMLVIVATVLLLCTTFDVASGDCLDTISPLTAPKGRLDSPKPGETGVCAWRITVSENLRIIFYFDSYKLYSPGCIELKDGPTAPPWKTFCEQYPMPEPIATNKSSLFVQLKLSTFHSKSWFSAQYITLPFERCLWLCVYVVAVLTSLPCDHNTSAYGATIDLRQTSSAEITSPNFPGRYPRNSYFKWTIFAPSGFRIKIELPKFDILNSGGKCSRDALVVLDGSSADSDLLVRLCGARRQADLYTSGNSATLQFMSSVESGYSDNIGFKATISREAKLYLIVVPCAIGVVLATLLVGAVVLRCRRRSSSSVTYPRMQMSRLNDDDHFSTTQMSDVETPNEASLPVYRPTTQQIKKT